MGLLVLVRHGQASFLADDYDRLSALGEAQARLLGAFWARRGIHFDRVVTGPRVRQVRTAELAGEAYVAAGGTWPGHTVLPALDEMQAEALLKRSLADAERIHPRVGELLARYRAADAATSGPAFQRLFEAVTGMWVRGEIDTPGIESYAAFAARVHGALASLRGEGRGQRIVAFTSGGPVGVGMQLALGLDHPAALDLAMAVKNASVSEFLFTDQRFTLRTFNTLPHLDDPAHETMR